MNFPMGSSTLNFLSIQFWWPLEVSFATNLRLYLFDTNLFPVVFGKSLSKTFNLGSFLYGGVIVLVWHEGVVWFF